VAQEDTQLQAEKAKTADVATPAPAQSEPKADTAKKETAEKESSKKIGFDTFLSVELRVAEILEAERIEKSAKLMKLQVSLGEELGKRQIVAGVAKHYQAEELVGKRIAVVANLKPAKLMGETSEGMLLAASTGDSLELLFLSDAIAAGSSIS
jgi:methionyl-tRNA synthetase